MLQSVRYFYLEISSFTLVLSVTFVLECFHPLIFYLEKQSQLQSDVCRLQVYFTSAAIVVRLYNNSYTCKLHS